MTFSTNVPNSGQNPSLFPNQSNTNFSRLKTIISGDHVFNDTAADNDGVHNQVTYVNRTAPSSLLTGTNLINYSRNAQDSVPDQWYYDGAANHQTTWREQRGTVAMTTSYANIGAALPADSWGDILMFFNNGTYIEVQKASFACSNAFVFCWGYDMIANGDSNTTLIQFGNSTASTGLAIRGKLVSGSVGTWEYRITYRVPQ